MKYKLMPYVFAQAKQSTEHGLPMVRALFVEFPHDAGAWLCEDEYMFGSQILVAPLLEAGNSRTVYLPQGKWIDYQTGKVFGSGYQTIAVPRQDELIKGISKNPIPCIILVRDGSLIPRVPVAQNTSEIDWSRLTLTPYKADATVCTGYVYKPGDKNVQEIKQ